MQARINRILQRFSDEQTPELRDYLSDVIPDAQNGIIDDGARYDPHAFADKPDFVKEHLTGWK